MPSETKLEIEAEKPREVKIYNDEELRKIINDIMISEDFSLRKITKKNDDLSKEEIQTLVSTLFEIAQLSQKFLLQGSVNQAEVDKLTAPIEWVYLEAIEKVRIKQLNSQSVIMQLLLLITKFEINAQQRAWLKIALFMAITMRATGKKSYYRDVNVRFKLPIIRTSLIHTWLWRVIPDISLNSTIYYQELIAFFGDLAEHLKPKNANNRSPTKAQKEQIQISNQVGKIALYLGIISNLKDRKTADRELRKIEKQEQPNKSTHKPFSMPVPKQLEPTQVVRWQVIQPITEPPKNASLATLMQQDIERNFEGFKSTYFSSTRNLNLNKPMALEEHIDTFDIPFITGNAYKNQRHQNSIPLQVKTLNVQQHNISLKEQGLIADPLVLSPESYRAIFGEFVEDARLNEKYQSNNLTNQRLCASLFLLAMLSSTSVKWLIEGKNLKNTNLFYVSSRQALLTFSLNITRPKRLYDKNKFENEYSKIELPLPTKLLNYLKSVEKMPSNEDMQNYLAKVKNHCDIVHLSKGRIESAMQTILRHHIAGSNQHIAELICRAPISQATASYYSSHENLELCEHYHHAVIWLNQDKQLDLSYFLKKKDFTTGSGYALKPQYIQKILESLATICLDSKTVVELYNHYSIYTWLIFCLLTGVRPNNEISHIEDIDLEVGWLMIDDKPNRATKSHRLIPLGKIVRYHLENYKQFLSEFRHAHIHNAVISQKIETILLALERKDDKAEHHLLNLIRENSESMSSIKRGDVAKELEPILDLSPYFTRHFVRTQLEKHQVPMPFINEVIGHESHLQEALGDYSSLSKRELLDQAKVFDDIAVEIGLGDSSMFAHSVKQLMRELCS